MGANNVTSSTSSVEEESSFNTSLRVSSISFSEFRSYREFELSDIGELTILVGKNAAGKTNVLEGLQLLTSATSFRHPQISQLIRNGGNKARLSLEAADGNRQLEVSLRLESGKRRYAVNGKSKLAADVRGLLPAVLFTPDDLQLVKKGSSIKRDTLDDLGMQLTRNYYTVRHDYEKTIRYKNRLLRDEASPDLVASINETLVTCGAQLHCLRLALFKRLIPHVKRVYGDISQDGEEFQASYIPSWGRLDSQRLNNRLNEKDTVEFSSNPSEIRKVLHDYLDIYEEEERRRGRSIIGPHNDQVSFFLSGRDASSFASQGQQRSIVLAWKMAEVQLVREVLGVTPVLLLDDVLSELDSARREMLVGFVTEDVQTFITATDLSGFAPELLERARVVSIHSPSSEDSYDEKQLYI